MNKLYLDVLQIDQTGNICKAWILHCFATFVLMCSKWCLDK